MKTLYVRLNQSEPAAITWVCQADDDYEVCTLAPENLASYQIVVLMPAVLMTWHTLEINAPTLRQKKAAIPFALAQEISQDLEEVYYQYEIKDDKVQVGVIAKKVLDIYLGELATLGIKIDYLISEVQALPAQDCVILYDEDEVIIKQDQHYYGLQSSIALSILDTLASSSPRVYATSEVANQYGLTDYDEIDDASLFLAQHCQVQSGLNFMQLFSQKKYLLKAVKPYLFSLVLLASLLIAYPVGLWLEQAHNRQQLGEIQQQMTTLYKQVNPLAKNIFDPYAQFVSYAKKQTSSSESNFLGLLKKVEESFSKEIDIDSLQYQKSGILLKISGNNLTQLEQFKTKLARYFKVEIKQSTQHQQMTKMTLQLGSL